MQRVQTSNTRSIPDAAVNGISLPILRVDGINYNLSELDRFDLNELKTLIEADIANIEMQLESGHTGSWAKPGWEASAAYARTMKMKQVTLIKTEQSRRKATVPSLQQFFVDLAYKVLDSTLFDSVMRAAKDQHKLALTAV